MMKPTRAQWYNTTLGTTGCTTRHGGTSKSMPRGTTN